MLCSHRWVHGLTLFLSSLSGHLTQRTLRSAQGLPPSDAPPLPPPSPGADAGGAGEGNSGGSDGASVVPLAPMPDRTLHAAAAVVARLAASAQYSKVRLLAAPVGRADPASAFMTAAPASWWRSAARSKSLSIFA